MLKTPPLTDTSPDRALLARPANATGVTAPGATEAALEASSDLYETMEAGAAPIAVTGESMVKAPGGRTAAA
jgi:hypothetical protein